MAAPNSHGTADAQNGKAMASQGTMSAAKYANYKMAYNSAKK